MSNIIAFSKNLVYGVGGAERSLVEELKKVGPTDNVTLASVQGVKSFNAHKLKLELPANFNIAAFQPRILINRFFFNEYLLNRDTIRAFITSECSDFDELWAQNLWAPVAINSFSKRTVYFARDENFLNVRPNYFSGIKRYAKKFYDCLDSPGFITYCKDNRLAIESADEVIANSKFMAKEIKDRFGRVAKVQYPFIDPDRLKKAFADVVDNIPPEQKGIVLLGDSKIKGVDIVKKLADDLPLEKFYIFSRAVEEPLRAKNICYMPWVRSPEHAFKYAKLVVMPSICQEAYGRVAAESLALGIPCVVNNIGGLPEAVNYEEPLVARSYQDFKVKVRKILKDVY
ncbi:glycosyltransferase [Psychrobium sp. MM17-31]|uniref:glycosyltransferase n=1 Tax=Psychrobium sp. MM17-31 TaxID=2917758 RepID=UPI001EF52BF2|nr:glycosyltransferase [Psychrobium sp. MM17-31]